MESGNYDLSSFQYAYSTISQTIATGFALLTAIVMYCLQTITATFPTRARTLESFLASSPQLRGELNMAADVGDWDKWIEFHKKIGFSITDEDDKILIDQRSLRDKFGEDLETIQRIKQRTRKALDATIFTIGWSLLLIPLMNKQIICNQIGFALAWIAVIGVTFSGLNCLRRYRPLVIAVIKPVRATREAASRLGDRSPSGSGNGLEQSLGE